jgi:diacylglycerol O-acyltransferase / wax synthase
MPRRHELSALDELFLRLEGPEVHMHVGSVAIFRGSPPARAELVDMFDRRLDLVPRLRQVVAEVPLGLGRPVWLDDASFDLDRHISTETAHDDLNALVAGLMSHPLDRSRPLWEVCLVDGLADDRFALVSKTHHSLVDGVAGADVIAVMLDPSPTVPVRPRSVWHPDPAPSPETLGREALHRLVNAPGETATRILAALAEDPAGITQRLAAKLGAVADFVAESFSAPPSTLNQPIGTHRRFETVLADLQDLLSVKRMFGVKLNDVVLSVVAGGLRHLLQSRGDSVAGGPLRAGVPISLRTPGEPLTLGNRIASVWAALPVQEPDPATRLARVHAEMTRLKSSDQVAGVEALLSIGEWLPPALVAHAARLLARQRAFNLVITNVPGPRVPLYCLGRRMTELYPLVPLGANATVAVAVFSYDTTIGLGIMGDHDAAPDLSLLAEGIEKEIAALVRS